MAKLNWFGSKPHYQQIVISAIPDNTEICWILFSYLQDEKVELINLRGHETL